MRRPDFLVVGAARSGTTTLHSYLMQHPQIFLPKVKEPGFFVFEGEGINYVKGKFAFAIRSFEEYNRLFGRARDDQKKGEMSTPYLYLYEKTIATLKKYYNDYNDIRIVMLLRNPVDRAFSQYKWRVRDGREPLSFEEAVYAESKRKKENFSFDYYYVDRGYYFNQVKAYLENFSDVHIMLTNDFMEDPQKELKNLCRFLGVDDFDFRKERDQNESGMPRSKILSRLVTTESRFKFKIWYALPDKLRKSIRSSFNFMNSERNSSLKLSSSMREKLVRLYTADILKLQQLIGRDLSGWLK